MDSIGEIVNLTSNDANRIMRLSPYLHNLWSAPFQIIVGMSLLVNYLGPSALVGLVVMALVVPFKKRLAARLSKQRKQVVKLTDRRVKLITDVVNGIKVVKLYSWEASFGATVAGTRTDAAWPGKYCRVGSEHCSLFGKQRSEFDARNLCSDLNAV